MNLQEIKDRVKYIQSVSYDDEKAHAEEDALREDFIKYLAERKDRVGQKAKEILKTSSMLFRRWCA